ncbi:MAG TPA: extracellular solute-binding protein [Verrucomicrobiae bacterium]|nr:extracellular solute-binding protein [Verrucomicrobiae bacterium]
MNTFRVAVRAFPPFEFAIRKQWQSFDAGARTGLELEAVALDLHPLHDALFGPAAGEWDAAFVVTDWIAEAAASTTLLDLAPYIAAGPPDGFPSAWSDSLLRFQRVGGQILGLPYHDGPECLIYRKDLFDEAGLAPPRSWDDFYEAARRLHRPEQNRYGTIFAGFPDGHNTVYDFCLQVWSRGGDLLDPHGRIRLDSDAARQGLQFYRRIVRDPSAVHPRCAEFDSVKSGYAFANGEAAFMVNWFGFAAMCQTAAESKVKDRVAVAEIPGGVSLNVYWTLAIPSTCRRPELAWSFLRHCASAGMDKLLTLEGGIGCRRSTWMDDDVNRAIPFYREMDRLHTGARELPLMPDWSRRAAVIDEMVIEALKSDRPEAELLAEAQERMERTV